MNLILAENYPSKDYPDVQSYIHCRCLFYKKQGLDFLVLSFRAKAPYCYEGVYVTTWKEFRRNHPNEIGLLMSHAPNLRNHLRFILEFKNLIKNVIFVFHGFEVLRIVDKNPFPYKGSLSLKLKKIIIYSYDFIKLPVFKIFASRIIAGRKVESVFVSNSLLHDTCHDLKVTEGFFKNYQIINNPIHPVFYEQTYIAPSNERKKIICIRPFDDLKYGADLYWDLAKKYPQYDFHLFGKGSYFDKWELPSNLIIQKAVFHVKDLPTLLNQYDCSVLFTRWDSQGVLACEFATYGIPLITSDLPVCIEMLGEYKNVILVNNDLDFDLNEILKNLPSASSKPQKFTYANTVQKEINLIKRMMP